MGYIPPDAKWYLADIVFEIIIEGDPTSVVHTNTVLVRADSPEEAYQKAVDLGVGGEQSYHNLAGQKVRFQFRGLRDLNVIHDELEHGAELIYSEELGMSEHSIQKWITPKRELGVFRPITPSRAPDYRSSEVMEKLYKEFPHLRPGGN